MIYSIAPTPFDGMMAIKHGHSTLVRRHLTAILHFNLEFAQSSIIEWNIQGEMCAMNADQTVGLMYLLARKRAAAGLSITEVAQRAHVNKATVWRLEQGLIATPRVHSLLAIAEVLEIPLANLLVEVGWLPDGELPSIGPYLRAKYAQLPEKAIEDVEKYIATILSRLDTDAETEDNRATHHKRC